MAKYGQIPSHIQKRIVQKKQRLALHGKLGSKKIKQINQRMQIDFVYHSNKIEGSTLSRGETELILRGIILGKKSIPEALLAKNRGDVLVAQNHPDAIRLVKEIAFNKSRKVTESDIKKIHRVMMHGVIASAGKYRDHDITVRGAGFAPPPFYEISKHMKELVFMLNNNPDELRPIEFASQLHYDFVWIHPFEDGNGRMARLLLNLILVRSGYPFVVIKSVDKPKYLRSLIQMDTDGNFEPFLTFIARCAEQTLDLYLAPSRPRPEERFLPLSVLAKGTGHSADYWSLLARKGRIDAIKEGKTWKTTRKIIQMYLNEVSRKIGPKIKRKDIVKAIRSSRDER